MRYCPLARRRIFFMLPRACAHYRDLFFWLLLQYMFDMTGLFRRQGRS